MRLSELVANLVRKAETALLKSTVGQGIKTMLLNFLAGRQLDGEFCLRLCLRSPFAIGFCQSEGERVSVVKRRLLCP